MKRLLILLSVLALLCACADPKPAASGPVDIDLTAMSGTMVYSYVYEMLSHPDAYIGKTVKMQGLFAVYEAETRNYYACIIQDATACCAQGMEFLPSASLTYPDDFPATGEPVTVVGTFRTYPEGDETYCELYNASFERP